MRIMVVDDERLILAGLQSFLRKIEEPKCEVSVAQSGKQALDMLEISPVDVLITDVSMQGMSGLELIEKAAAKGYAGRFVVLSGYDSFEYVRTAMRLGVVDYLLKPMDKDELYEIICRIDREGKRPEQAERLAPYRRFFSHLETKEMSYLLRTCFQFIQGNYRNGISLAMLSEYTGKTENYLCACFKKELDATFLEIVNEMRLRDSLYLLLYEPSLSVQDIAGKVGYHTERQLFRLIRNQLGITPQQVRNQAGLE